MYLFVLVVVLHLVIQLDTLKGRYFGRELESLRVNHKIERLHNFIA